MKNNTVFPCIRINPLVKGFLLCGLYGMAGIGHADTIVGRPTQITGDSPINYDGCLAQTQRSTLYRNSESEPFLAVNPLDPKNMIVAYHQDRFAKTGGAGAIGSHYTKDGGKSWHRVTIPFTYCSGATAGAVGAFDRTTDPWVAFEAKGNKAHIIGLSFDQDPFTGHIGGTVMVANSENGGESYRNPLVKIQEVSRLGPNVRLLDKNSITADPNIKGKLHAVWITYTGPNKDIGKSFYSSSLDSGRTWTAGKRIYNPKNDFSPDEAIESIETQGNQIAVLPSGTLVNVFVRNTATPSGEQLSDIGVIRSTNQGEKWSKDPFIISGLVNRPIVDVVNGADIPIRGTEASLPDVAVDRKTGHLYVVWAARDGSDNDKNSVFISKSINEGLTWSPKKKINQAPTVDAFIPVVHVADNGIVGVLYYDMRYDAPNDTEFTADAFLLTLTPDLKVREKGETRLSPTSMDLRQAALLISGSTPPLPNGYFLGDYFGLDSVVNDFVAAYTVVNPLGLSIVLPDPQAFAIDNHNRQDIWFAKISTAK
ncbi:MAG: BNR/Asp-box repeat-containing protein [Herminiimonas sp.]|nr:BNR/Asp-box repeat-containing protein [Herminiimonas sp.]